MFKDNKRHIFKLWAKFMKISESSQKEVQETVMNTGNELMEIWKHCPEVEEEYQVYSAHHVQFNHGLII